ncbi:MAG: hypothetical protein KGJ13_06590 [Patescibacteria group bacterium]|nr:hypothetical protein [Patescibacteria group bacterium]
MQLPLQSVVPEQVFVMPQAFAEEVRVQGWPLGLNGVAPEQEPSHWMVPPDWPQALMLQDWPSLNTQPKQDAALQLPSHWMVPTLPQEFEQEEPWLGSHEGGGGGGGGGQDVLDGGLHEPVQLPLQSVVPVQVAVWPQELAPEVRVQG